MTTSRIIKALPISIIAIILIYTWSVIVFSGENAASIKHWIGLVLFMLIIYFCFARYKYGALLSILFLLLSTFNIIGLFPKLASTSYFFKIGGMDISTPYVEWKSVLLLIFFLVCNGDYIIGSYLDFKEKREEKSHKR